MEFAAHSIQSQRKQRIMIDPVEILKAILGLAILIAVTLSGIHLSRQQRVSRSLRNSILISARVVIVYVTAFFALCVILGLAVNWFLILVLIVLLLSPLASIDEGATFFNVVLATDPLGVLIAAVTLFPVYVLKQYVLGFPDRDQIVLSPAQESRTEPMVFEPEVPDLGQEMVIVVATLKPIGKVEFKGTRYDAASFDGTMIDVGQTVQVCDRRNRMFVVRTVDG